MGNSQLERWLDYLNQQGKSQHTIAAYRRAMQQFIRWNSKTYGVDDFDSKRVIPRDVRDWKGYQQTAEQVKPTTVNQRLTALSRFRE